VIGPRSSGQGLARLCASVAAASPPELLRGRVAAYYASYATGDLAAREALFAEDCRFEDPAGNIVAGDRESLHAFFDGGIPAHWSTTFRLDRTAVVGDEALATATLTLRVGERPPVQVIVNAHFAFDAAGLISRVRTFFDEGAMTDLPV
jgi:ketosteroid isomerase-like protein